MKEGVHDLEKDYEFSFCMHHTTLLFYFAFFLVKADMFPLLRESHFPLTWLDFCGRLGEAKL